MANAGKAGRRARVAMAPANKTARGDVKIAQTAEQQPIGFNNVMATDNAPLSSEQLKLMSVVIPARDEESCIASTVEHLHVELRLHNVPHEIIVVDDGSTDRTWQILDSLRSRIPELKPIRSPGPHGFGRAIVRGLDAMQGDAVVIMMADESDDCRDVVRYWKTLQRRI